MLPPSRVYTNMNRGIEGNCPKRNVAWLSTPPFDRTIFKNRTRYTCTNDRNSQWIANMWNDYWQGENLHGRTVSFKWTNITSQNDATVLRYTFRYKRAIRPGTNATANLYELERASRPRTTSCLGVNGVINNKPGEIFLFSSSSTRLETSRIKKWRWKWSRRNVK